MKSLLEAQGDLIVRRDGEGRIAYANDAYCAPRRRAARRADRTAVSPPAFWSKAAFSCSPTARVCTTRR